MDFRLLGPLEVQDGEAEVKLVHQAEEILGRSYAINAATANELGMAETDCASARLAILRGEYARARQLLDGAREVFERRGA